MNEEKDMKEKKFCGIIMPIAAMDNYTSEHWAEVKNIIVEATSQVKGICFKTEIVSDSDGEINVIHKRIIQNIYNADIVICDISGKNPNVLFELGMRLTFDKPTIIIKDDQTDFMFDTGVIEHLQYPKDLRFKKIVDFKEELAKRIKITYEKSVSDSSYSTFLGNFGEFKVPSLKQTSISSVEQLVLEEVSTLRSEFIKFKKEALRTNRNRDSKTTTWSDLSISDSINDEEVPFIELVKAIIDYSENNKINHIPGYPFLKDKTFIDFIAKKFNIGFSSLSHSLQDRIINYAHNSRSESSLPF
ncbi:hypothetical protein [Bacillus gobiensis]|uniref:hypothetical protein n=1 Tax=Bacillus gobiensis TaxID=1441095 RepID=UPI003D235F3A